MRAARLCRPIRAAAGHGADGRPQRSPGMIGINPRQPVGCDDPFDHVGDDGGDGPISDPHGDDGAVPGASQRTVSAGQAWWAAKAGHVEPA